MESAFSKPLTNSSISPFLFRLHRRFGAAPPSRSHSPLAQILTRRLRCVGNSTTGARHFHGPNAFGSVPLKALRTIGAVVPLVRCRLQCVSSSAASFASGGGGGGFGGGGGDGGGGGGGSDGGDAPREDPAAAEEAGDVIILDVGGMSCGGCASSVKRILESQPQVLSASVNLTTETAVVWPASDAKSVPNWQKQLGEALAKHLTTCGFKSNLRVAGERATEGDILQ